MSDRPRYLFVTGRLAEFALRQVLDRLAPRAGFEAEVAVMPITVAALMTPRWIARHLEVPAGVEKVVPAWSLRRRPRPGAREVGRSPRRERARRSRRPASLLRPGGAAASRIWRVSDRDPGRDQPCVAPHRWKSCWRRRRRFREEGADLIDLGCDPAGRWDGVREAVAALRQEGLRVSIDSFDGEEVAEAVAAGAELVLSVDASNRERAVAWGGEVVVIPDVPGTLDGLDATVAFLDRDRVPYRIDPIIEPIGFGFAASLGRYLEVRRRYPDAEILMGVGNLTELTEVDSAGVNAVLIGFCEELGIRSVLTTAVINWARSSVREIDIARRLAHHAVSRRALPKHVDPRLVMLRDPGSPSSARPIWPSSSGGSATRTGGSSPRAVLIHALNNQHLLRDTRPLPAVRADGHRRPVARLLPGL